MTKFLLHSYIKDFDNEHIKDMQDKLFSFGVLSKDYPDENLILPTAFICIMAFVVQIIQITLSNILIENNMIIILSYLTPIIITLLIIVSLFLENIKMQYLKNV